MEVKYDKFPAIRVKGHENDYAAGWQALADSVSNAASPVVFDLYPGASQEAVQDHIANGFDVVIDACDIYKDKDILEQILAHHVTEDRIFGTMFYGVLQDLIDEKKLAEAKEKAALAEAEGRRVLVIGPGASKIIDGTLFYGDMARWEVQLRYRRGMPNFFFDNPKEDPLRKIKRGFFIEWRVFDKHKKESFDNVDWFVDLNEDTPKLATGDAVRDGLAQAVKGPFRTKPYFDPGVWGGQWMKDVCGLDQNEKNFAWSFDGVPEENAILLDFGSGKMELPAMDLVLTHPKELLGPQVYSRFGAEFPIRFDFLDTMGGQNLSLQVHPLTEYIHRTFGMAYTQDESYYILDAKKGAHVYLGLKEGVDPEEMMAALEEANAGGRPFDAEKYVNKIPAKKHDHFLIPAGTIHCSGADSMVLEVSATPYCFTFKLWDWGRLGLDGLPRPVHLDHGRKNIQWDRQTSWVMDNLVNNIWTISETETVKEEHTGLHELEFIETRRYWMDTEVEIDPENNVNMCNLIEGDEAVIESPEGTFEPFPIHYAETFVIPADAGRYVIRNTGDKPIGVLRAYVRTPKAD